MNGIVDIYGKSVAVRLSGAAVAALNARNSPLLVEMGLFFSCAARKEVRFAEEATGDADSFITPRLAVRFSPVVNRLCPTGGESTTPKFEHGTVNNPVAFVPHWLHIDFHAGEWLGEFGYGGE